MILISNIVKILFVLLLVSIGFSHSPKKGTMNSIGWTGDCFLEQFPHDKSMNEMTKAERVEYNLWLPLLIGFLNGSFYSINQAVINSKLETDGLDKFDLLTPMRDMTIDKKFKILKKWCENNPSKTHLSIEYVMFVAFKELN